MNKYSWIVLAVLAFAKANYATAQKTSFKQEREQRIDKAQFPSPASELVEKIAGGSRIKYYQEVDGDMSSFEGKFKNNRKRYSVEFSEDGILEDIEIEVKSKEVPSNLWNSVSNQLDSICNRWRVEKVQEQYLPMDFSIDKLLDNIAASNYQYLELIVAFKEQRKIYRKELLVNTNGDIILVRDVKRIAYDFLLF